MTHVFKTGRKFAVVLVLAFAVAFAGFSLFAKMDIIR